MTRYLGLTAIGVVIGLVSAEAGAVGIFLSLVAAIGASVVSPASDRSRSSGLLLASSAMTISVLLGRLVLIDAHDPAVGLAPGTQELFVAAIVLSILGIAATIAGGRPWPGPRSLLVVVAVGLLIGVVALGAEVVSAAWDPAAIHDAANLPSRLNVCGRDWNEDASGRQVTFEQARAMKSSGAPSVVATGPFAPCPSGPCTRAADGPCDTVTFVRVGVDAYVAYELSGGP